MSARSGPDVILRGHQWRPMPGGQDPPPGGDLHLQVVLSSIAPELDGGQPTGWLLVRGWREDPNGLCRVLASVRVRADGLPAQIRQQARRTRGCTCPMEWW